MPASPVPATKDPGTYDRILEVAMARFAIAGYRGTSVRRIADDVGVTQPALYYHFGSKDGILAELVQPLIARGAQLLDHLGALRVPRRELASHAFEGYYDLIVDHSDVFFFVESDRAVRSHPDAGHRLADQAQQLVDIVAGGQAITRRIRAMAAMGAIRRPLRLPGLDTKRHKRAVLACAEAAFEARP